MELKEGYKLTDLGLIPIDWDVKSYGEIFKFLSTATYSRSQLSETDEIKYIHYGDIHTKWNFHLDISKSSLPSIKVEMLKSYSQIKDGDVIMADVSEDYNGVGKSVEIKSIGNTNAIAGLHTFLLRDSNNIFVNGYRGYIHTINVVKKQFDELATGMKVYGVSKSNLKNVLIPIPTKTEQTAIATALSEANALISSLEKLIEKKQAIKQGIMQKLLTPKEGWVETNLGEIALIQRGASPRPIDSPLWFDENSKVGWVRISDVTRSVKYLFETAQKLSEEGIKNSRYVQAGELIMSICATIGRPILTAIDVCIHDGFVVFNEPMVDKEFLYYCLTYIEKEWAKTGQTGSQMNLNTDIIQARTFAFPKEIQEQRLIAEILSDMDNEILVFEQKLFKYKMLKQGMMQELLTGKTRLV